MDHDGIEMKSKRKRLTETEKAFVVRELACFGSPKEVSEALMEELGVRLAPQNIEAYDPGKRAGRHLSKKWRELFEITREAFLKHIEVHVPEANRAVRVKKLARASRAFEGLGNYIGMSEMFERIAKELGGSYTNQRQLTGKGGGPIEHRISDMTDEEVEVRMAEILAKKPA